MQNNISTLRDKLFEQLDRLSDPKLDLDKETTRAVHVVNVAAAIVETARVEIEFLAAIQSDGKEGSPFFTQKKIGK